jgi:hypothetical protein
MSPCFIAQFVVFDGVHSKLPPLKVTIHAAVCQEIHGVMQAVLGEFRAYAAHPRRTSRSSFASSTLHASRHSTTTPP